MRALVDDLLLLSQIESGQMEMQHAHVDLRRCSSARSSASSGRSATPASSHGLRVGASADRPRRRAAARAGVLEPHRERRAPHAAGRHDHDQRRRIEPRRRASSVGVHNTGSVIPPEDLPRVFERFFQVDRARARKGGSSGLGLSIVSEIVEAHGGIGARGERREHRHGVHRHACRPATPATGRDGHPGAPGEPKQKPLAPRRPDATRTDRLSGAVSSRRASRYACRVSRRDPRRRRRHAAAAAHLRPAQGARAAAQPAAARVPPAQPAGSTASTTSCSPARRGCGEIEEHFGDGAALGVRMHYAYEDRPLGSGRAVKEAARFAGAEGTLVVCNGDILTNVDLTAMIARHRETGATLSISLAPVDDPWHFGVVDVDERLAHRALRREAAAGRGAEQPDQRRHVALGAGDAGPHPRRRHRRTRRLLRARALPRHHRRRDARTGVHGGSLGRRRFAGPLLPRDAAAAGARRRATAAARSCIEEGAEVHPTRGARRAGHDRRAARSSKRARASTGRP